MKIAKISLTNYRNFKERSFIFSSGITVVVGPNAVGKTNLLEAIYLLSTGKSFKAKLEEEMVSHNQEVARVKGVVKLPGVDESKIELETVLTRGEMGMGTATIEKVPRKKLLVDGVAKRLVDFAGNFKAVVFGPWDLDLVTESPSVRRRFLDAVLSQVDREYRRSILSYEKGLRQRNKLLFRIREEGLSRSQLLFWDKLLIKNGDYISRAREGFIDFVNATPSLNEIQFSLDYDKSAISETRLEQYAQEEVAAATTLVGPHRDDFIFNSMETGVGVTSQKDLSRYGSRGEQRMSVLWLKLAELEFVQRSTGEKCSLLLDDIFSELDHEHREIVMKASLNQQTIITTADPHFVEGLEKVKVISI